MEREDDAGCLHCNDNIAGVEDYRNSLIILSEERDRSLSIVRLATYWEGQVGYKR